MQGLKLACFKWIAALSGHLAGRRRRARLPWLNTPQSWLAGKSATESFGSLAQLRTLQIRHFVPDLQGAI
jgi:hypothetical protein